MLIVLYIRCWRPTSSTSTHTTIANTHKQTYKNMNAWETKRFAGFKTNERKKPTAKQNNPKKKYRATEFSAYTHKFNVNMPNKNHSCLEAFWTQVIYVEIRNERKGAYIIFEPKLYSNRHRTKPNRIANVKLFRRT